MTKPVVLLILDGWGVAKPSGGNAVSKADTPNFDYLLKRYPSCVLSAASREVGLPWGEVGNSEVGHLTLGLGRVIDQDLSQINRRLAEGKLFSQPAVQSLLESTGDIHIVSLVSDGGVHSHIDHLVAFINLLKNEDKNVFIHAILDGRDTPQKSAEKFLLAVQQAIGESPKIKIADLSGRYFAMDRDKRWDRVEKAYRVMTSNAKTEISWQDALKAGYDQKQTDEFFEPVTISTQGAVKNGDSILFLNYRPDRIIQLAKAFVDTNFDSFKRELINVKTAVTMTDYEDNLPTEEILSTVELSDPKTNPLTNGLGEIVSVNKLKQVRIAETEKYAHVTYFFSGGQKSELPGEEHILVPSPKVATYDLKPEMSAGEIVRKFKAALKNQNHLIVINLANPDMVGHTGDIPATVKAIEYTDVCLGEIWKAVAQERYHLLVTADHGNAEQMIYHNGQPDKEHSVNPVPLIIASPDISVAEKILVKNDLADIEPIGLISDITPTILELLEIKPPAEITGASLLNIA